MTNRPYNDKKENFRKRGAPPPLGRYFSTIAFMYVFASAQVEVSSNYANRGYELLVFSQR